jgi:teichuronic acid exporter
MSIERQAIAGLKWTAMAKVLGQTVGWLITLVIVRLLAPEDYGLMAITTVIIAILASVAELGVGASLVQAPTLARDELKRVAGLVVSLNLAAGLLVALCAPLAAFFFNEARLTPVIQVSALQFVINALCTVPQAFAYRDMEFKWLAWIELISGLAANLCTLALAWLGAGVWALVLGSLAGGAVRAALLLAGGRSVRPVFRLDGIRRHLSFGGALTASRLAWQIVSQSDVLIAGRFMTQEAVGIYSVAFHLAALPMQKIMSIVNQIAFPAFARLQGDLPRLRAGVLDASRLLTFVSVPAAWGMSAIAPEFVRLAFGEKWEAVVFPLQVLSLIVPLRMLSAMLITSVAALGRVAENLQYTFVGAVVLIPGFLIGMQWGVSGLACAWLVGTPVISIITLPRIGNVLGLRVANIVSSVWAPVTAGAAMYGVVMGTRALLVEVEDLYRLPTLMTVGAATYLGLVSLFDRRISRDLKRIFSALRD